MSQLGARSATESAIMETIKDLMRGRTTLIATHRLATVHNVDQIIVLEHGHIVEQGAVRSCRARRRLRETLRVWKIYRMMLAPQL